tara:strand:- start:9545 stop:9763 length:219 start_codon:yes stop_codon:yes gene_type:complete
MLSAELGDLVIAPKFEYVGIIINLDKEDLERDNMIWVQIMWSDGQITWEDLRASDNLFQLLRLQGECTDESR